MYNCNKSRVSIMISYKNDVAPIATYYPMYIGL